MSAAHRCHHEIVDSSRVSSSVGLSGPGGWSSREAGSGIGQRQVRPLPRSDLEGSHEAVVAVAGELEVRPDDQGVVAAHGAPDALAPVAQPRPDLPVVEAGRHAQRQLHAPSVSFDDAQQLSMGIGLSSFAHGKAVDDPSLASGRADRGLQHQGVMQVAPCRARSRFGRGECAEPAAVVVEDSGEDRRRVDPRHAAPVDRASPRQERNTVTVGKKGVVADRGASTGVLGVGHAQTSLGYCEMASSSPRCRR